MALSQANVPNWNLDFASKHRVVGNETPTPPPFSFPAWLQTQPNGPIRDWNGRLRNASDSSTHSRIALLMGEGGGEDYTSISLRVSLYLLRSVI